MLARLFHVLAARRRLVAGLCVDGRFTFRAADGSFSCTVEGNLAGGVVWLELKHAMSDRRIGPLAIVVDGQASVDLGLLTW